MFISFLRTIILYLLIVVTLRVLGKRQVGELEPAELVVAILISDLSAVPMQDIGIPLLAGILPIVTLLALEMLASELSLRSLRFRGILCGKPVFIIRNGVIDQRAMERNRLTTDELCCALRQKGILEVEQVQYAVLETSGQLSTFLYPQFEPLTAKEQNKKPKAPDYPVMVISDGRIIRENLQVLGRDEIWLQGELDRQRADPEDVFLMTATEKGETYMVRREVTP